MFKDFLFLTLKGIRYRPVRSWLTMLGIVIGIILVVIILTLSDGIKGTIARTLQSFGSNIIIILPGKDTNPILGVLGGVKFKISDLTDLENIKGVKFVVPMDNKILNTEYKGEKKSVMVHAANWKNYIKVMESSQGIRLEKGAWPKDDNVNDVVVGYRLAQDLFSKRINIGDEFIIKSKRFRVVGSLSEIGEQMLDNVAFISSNIFRQLTGIKTGASSGLVRLEDKADTNLIAKEIKFSLSKQETVRDFSILTPDKVTRLSDDVLGIVESILVTIAIISLVVGAVGIMNTMYTSVLERTRQIGVMKAVGATNEMILSLFLIESGMIGLVGGILGVIFGIVASYMIGGIAADFGIRGIFSFSSIDFSGLFIVLLITFMTGVVSGILPARQASKMEPAEALRYE